MNTALLVLLLTLACASASAVRGAVPISVHYHETVGIPAAERIRLAEANADPAGSVGSVDPAGSVGSVDPAGRVAGGQPAPLGAHPYLAGLLISLTTGQTSVCGASLLAPTKLLTAAHCWFDGRYQGEEVTAVLGSTTLFSGGTRVTSRAVEPHAAFNPANLNNDLAVITIPPVAYSATIQPIELPSGFLAWLTFEYNWATVAGFGVTRDDESITLNQSLRQASVMVVNNLDCATVYGWSVVASTLCTSGQGRVGPCGGDSGGPLALTLSGVTYLIGVTSFHAAGGCDIGFPGGYARVTAFLPWIQARI